jgi:hypothetical protein
MEIYNPLFLAAIVCIYSIWEFFLRRVLLKNLDQFSDKTSNQSNKKIFSNGVILLLMLVIGTSGFLSAELLIGYGVIAIMIIFWEIVSKKWSSSKLSLELFVCKQFLVLFLFCVLFVKVSPIESHEWYVELEIFFFSVLGDLGYTIQNEAFRILMMISAFCFNIDGGTKIVRGILAKFPVLYARVMKKLNSNQNDSIDKREGEENVGEWIGIIERVITFIFVLTGHYIAIAFVLTAKSIARFKELEDKDFSEYYLLGTSGSFLVALFSGLVIRAFF